jgi:mycofactocin precursor
MAERPDEELATGELSTDELLVEEVSIDGMCGVY